MLTIALGVAAGIVLGVLALLLLAHSVARQRVIHAWDSHLRTYKTPLVAQGLSEPTAERVVRARAAAALHAWDVAVARGASGPDVAEAVSNAANKAEITLLMEALKAALDARPGGLDKALEDLKAEAKPETGP